MKSTDKLPGTPASRRRFLQLSAAGVMGTALAGLGSGSAMGATGAGKGRGAGDRLAWSAAVDIGAEVVVESNVEVRWLPIAYGWRGAGGGSSHGVIGVSFHERPPGATSETEGDRRSYDDGQTWPDYANDGTIVIPSMQGTDGTLYRWPYSMTLVPGTDGLQAKLAYRTSDDFGTTWVSRTGFFVSDVPIAAAGFHFNPGSFELDGVIYASLYGHYADDVRDRVVWVSSADEGQTWTAISDVAVGDDEPIDGTEGFNEAFVARVADGSLLAVMRTGNNLPLYQARSVDDGAHWDTPAPVTTADGSVAVGISPNLLLLANGMLVLTTGRPGNRLYVAADGIGESWGNAIAVGSYDSSGYSPIVALGDDELLFFGDAGTRFTQPTPDPYKIWCRRISVVPECSLAPPGRPPIQLPEAACRAFARGRH
jgi:hypothetical protein